MHGEVPVLTLAALLPASLMLPSFVVLWGRGFIWEQHM